MLIKFILVLFITLGFTNIALASPDIVIKSGEKKQKVVPIKKSEIKNVNVKNIVSNPNWEIDGQKESKKAILKGNSSSGEYRCH